MYRIPDWSDLGNIDSTTKGSWTAQEMTREEYRHYFSGAVFQDKVPDVSEVDGEAPLLYPVGVNLVRVICEALADATFGEWEDQLFRFEPSAEEMGDDATKEAARILSQILYNSSGNSLFWESDLNRNAYGGAAFKATVDFATFPYVRWNHIPLDGFYPIWDPDNWDELLEVYIVVEMTPEQAKAKYGLTFETDIVRRVEHWTRFNYENRIEGKRMDAYSGVNPWGVVPVVYCPRLRTDNWWGDAITPALMPVQDELNAVLADIGEAVNYNSHPTRWGINLPRAFNAKNYPLGANAMWDMGRAIGNSPKPEVGMLEANNPVPQEVFEYVAFLYNWARTSSFAPAVVFGEDNNGAQRSGATTELRMWPMEKYIRRTRSYLGASIRRLVWLTGKILKQKSFADVSSRAVTRMLEGKIAPVFYQILPPDRQKIVDEITKLLSTEPKAISLETAQKILGRGPGEVERIEQMYEDFDIQTSGEQADQAAKEARQAQAGRTAPQAKKEAA